MSLLQSNSSLVLLFNMAASQNDTVIVEGTVEAGYERVREAFANLVKEGHISRGQVCVYIKGKPAIDLCAKTKEHKDYDRDSLQILFSSSKTLTAIAMAILVDQKYISYKDSIIKHWPTFASTHGDFEKAKLRVKDVMRHESGLVRMDKCYDLENFMPDKIKAGSLTKAFEDLKMDRIAVDPDGKRNRQYHYCTQGYLANEISIKADPKNRTLGEVLRQKLDEVGLSDVMIGVDQDSLGRLQALDFPDLWTLAKNLFSSEDNTFFPTIQNLTMTMPSMVEGYSENVIKPRYERGLWSFSEMLPSRETFKPIAPVSVRRNGKDMALGATTLDTVLNSPEMVTSEHPGFNGVASARALAKLAAWMANKGQSLDGGETALMSQDTWEEMHADATVNADCEIGGFRTNFTQGGVNHFVKAEDDLQVEKWFKHSHLGYYGWKGLGGSMMMWHPEHEIGFSYVPATMVWYTQSLGAHVQSVFTECFNNIHGKKTETTGVLMSVDEKLLSMSDVVEAAMNAQNKKAKDIESRALKSSARQVIAKVLTNVSGEVIRHG